MLRKTEDKIRKSKRWYKKEKKKFPYKSKIKNDKEIKKKEKKEN